MYACFIAAFFFKPGGEALPGGGIVQRIARHDRLDLVQLRSAWRHNDIVIDLVRFRGL